MQFIHLQLTFILSFWAEMNDPSFAPRRNIFGAASQMLQNDGTNNSDTHVGDGIVWNHQNETAGQLQGRICSTRCKGRSRINYVYSDRCLQCFPCTCSEDCDRYGTCCPAEDDPWQPPPIERAECRKADIGWILQVTTCDPAYPHNQTHFLCESKALPRRRDTVLPVTSRATGVTYANRHCAQCHHDLSHQEEWAMACLHNQYLYNITNDTLYDESAILLPDICSPTVSSSHVSRQYFCDLSQSYYFSTGIISTCNVTGHWKKKMEHVRKGCEESDWSKGAMVIQQRNSVYANVLCAICNEWLTLHCYGQAGPVGLPGVLTNTEMVGGFRHAAPVVPSRPVNLTCPENEWKHPQDGCQKLQCSAGKVLGPDYTCTTSVERITGLGYHLRVLLMPVSLTVLVVHASTPPVPERQVPHTPLMSPPSSTPPTSPSPPSTTSPQMSPTSPSPPSPPSPQMSPTSSTPPTPPEPLVPPKLPVPVTPPTSPAPLESPVPPERLTLLEPPTILALSNFPALPAPPGPPGPPALPVNPASPLPEEKGKNLRFCSYSRNIKQATDDRFSFYHSGKSVTVTTAPVQNGTCFATKYGLHLERLLADGNKTCRFLDRTRERCEVQVDDSNRHAASFLTAEVEVDIVSSSADPRDVFETGATENIFQNYWTAFVGQYEVKLKVLGLDGGLYDDLMEKGGLYEGVVGDTTRFPADHKQEHQNPLSGLEHLFLPLSKGLLCPHLSFSADEFEMKKSDRDLQISFPFYLDSEMRPVSFSYMDYPNEVWLAQDQQLSMCFDTFQKVFPQNVTVIKPGPGVSKLRLILYVVCSSVSVTCLALTFFTYCLFKELRSLPGLNNVGLSLSLGAAQLSLLLHWYRDPDIKPLCISVGVFTHWLWLMAFSWMGVCCLHMMHVFVSNTRHTLSERETKKAFLHNILVTVLGSAVIVIITIVVSSSVSGGSSIGYGGWKCFLDTSLHRLLILAFVVPLGVVVLTNLACFFFTVVAIVRMQCLRSQDLNRRGSSQVLIYAKLSTVTGAGWVLALLSQVFSSEWMLVLTDLCTGLQGLLIFLAFVCNRRVWNLYRSKLFSSCRQPSPTSTASTSFTSKKA